MNTVPNAPGFKAWWNKLCTIVSASSGYPDRALTWVCKVERDSGYKVFNGSEGFGSLDIKFAVALKQICLKVLTRRVTVLEETWVDNHGAQFKGIQILVLLLQWFQESEKDYDFLNITHLNQLELNNGDIEAFLDKWEEILHQMRKTHPKDELLHLFRIQMRKSEKFKIHFMEFERLREDHPRKTYKYIFALAKRCCLQRRRDDVSAQYRSQSSPPANRGLAAKPGSGNQTGICYDW